MPRVKWLEKKRAIYRDLFTLSWYERWGRLKKQSVLEYSIVIDYVCQPEGSLALNTPPNPIASHGRQNLIQINHNMI